MDKNRFSPQDPAMPTTDSRTSPFYNDDDLALGLLNVRSLSVPGRFSNVISEIQAQGLDVLCLTETWLRQNDVMPDFGLSHAGLNFVSWPRFCNKRGGGLAIIYKNMFTLKELMLPSFESFEQVTVATTCEGRSIFTLSVIYRPPCSSLSKFISEFDDFLERMCMSSKLLIAGDFNIHMDNTCNYYVKRFSEILNQYGLRQFVHGPTHTAGHTIDLILARECDNLVKSTSTCDNGISDHSLVLCRMYMSQKCSSFSTCQIVRNWKAFNCEHFETDLSFSKICDANDLNSASSLSVLVQSYNDILSALLDKHAPLKTVRNSPHKRVPWFTRELNCAIRQRRQAERAWRRTRCAADRAVFVQQRNLVKKMVISQKRLYYEHLVDSHSDSPRDLWRLLNSFIKGVKPSCLPSFVSDDVGASAFATFFNEKIEKIRESISPSTFPSPENAPTDVPLFDHFDPVTITEVVKLISDSKPKFCLLDPVPAWIVKKNPYLFAPVLCAIANLSLSSGVFPETEKCALITPAIKKSSLDKDDLSNYRPISNLSFVSKVIERLVSVRIDRFLHLYHLMSPYQSAYRPSHSTETVLVRLCNDIAAARDRHLLTGVVFLDFSAAFDTVDYDILLERLHVSFNFSGVVLKWFSSYLKDRYQIVRFKSCKSSPYRLLCGVPQGSVLGPRLYSLYVSSISKIISSYELSHHIFADDICVYFSSSPVGIDNSVARVVNCIDHLCDWFNCNRLKLNGNKTTFILFNSHHLPTPVCINVSGVNVYPSQTVRYLGVTLDESLSFEQHMVNICKSSFAFLRSLYRIRPLLSLPCVLSLVNAFAFSRVDYCNSIFSFCNGRTISRLQRVQNCLARVVKNLRRRAPTSSAIRNLGWLRLNERITFKVCCLIHKCMYDTVPSYIRDLISFPCSKNAYISLRSQSSNSLFTPTSPFAMVRRAFSFHAPRLWNALPLSLRNESRFSVFKRKLKTHLL